MKKGLELILVATLFVCASGCGQRPSNGIVSNYTGSAILGGQDVVEVASDASDESDKREEVSSELYIVENVDMNEETIALYSLTQGKQLRYKYNMTTKFLDKYGGNSTWAEFTIGSVVTIGDLLPSSGALSQVQKSPDVWSYEDIKKYSIDEAIGMMVIDGKKYKLTDTTKTYSDDAKVPISNVGEDDIITVIGRDKEVISVSITTGHGYLSFTNTGVFDGSLIFIGKKIVSMVNGNATIQVPEGTYMVTVANNGWGGTKEFTVNRGENTMIDLDSMKGDGPSFCLMTFLVTVPDTYVYIDGKQIDVTEPQHVQYGNHRLVVKCTGYKPWKKTLVVNSESAEITLAMEADSEGGTPAENSPENYNSDDNQQGSTGSDNSSTNPENVREEETAGSSIKNNYDYEVDYLSTISDLISNLMN